MVDGLIRWSLSNRALVLALAALLFAVGAWRAFTLPVDVFPDLTAPTVTVLTEAHGMAPEEVERLVTLPIETALNGASGLRRLRSSSGVGISIVWAEFDWAVDVYRARQVVSERLQEARAQIPADIAPPQLAPVSSIMGEILFVALTNEDGDRMALRSVADWTVRRRLLAIPGVAQVIPIGGEVRQLQVVLSPERLAAYDLSIIEVMEALRDSSASTSAGFLVEGGEELLIHGVGRVDGARDLEDTIVSSREGRRVLVRDVGEVRFGPALSRGAAAFAGEPAVVIGIQKQPGANTLSLTDRLDAVFADIARELPPGTELHTDIFRQADFISLAVDNVADALRDGALLVLLILIVFLGALRPTLTSAVALPLSLVAAVFALDLLGITLNTMTLGGMAIAVGALVDDAIIDVENVVRRLRENAGKPVGARRPVFDVVLDASREVRASIVLATLIIALVFAPLFFLSGVEGRLLAPLGIAYVVALAASLFVALTVTPAMCLVVLEKGADRSHDDTRVLKALKRVYDRLLLPSLDRARSVVVAAAISLAVAIGALFGTTQSFLPAFNEGTLTISVVTLPGISLRDSDRLAHMVDEILLAQPEVARVARRTGRAELDEHAQGVNASELDVSLSLDGAPMGPFLTRLRAALDAVPGANISIGQPISHRIDHMTSGTRAGIAVKAFGVDLPSLHRVAAQLKALMEQVPGCVDVALEEFPSIPFARVLLDRRTVAAHGLRPHDVIQTMEVGLSGAVVAELREGDRRVDIVVRLPDDARSDLAALAALRVHTPDGGDVPLLALASVDRDAGPGSISRENVQRKVVVMANVDGEGLVEVVEAIRARVDASIALPEGVQIEYGGQFESAASAERSLFLLGLLVLLGVFALLVSGLGSLRDALLVLVNLPLALIGGVVGVYASGANVSVATIIGFIALFGIATRNGLLLVTHIRHLVEQEGVTSSREAVRRGSRERLAPVLMTALAAALALVPLALRHGEAGAEIQSPMAMVILFGLLSSTALNMIVVPVLYLHFGAATRGLARD